MKKYFLFFLACLTLQAPWFLRAQAPAFTYQGQLLDGGGPANGAYDLVFRLYDQPSGGAQLGPALTNSAVTVSNGLFALTLDFGSTNFSGADRWVEIGVRTNGSQDFTTLDPRQKLTPAPYAITALSVAGTIPSDKISGSYSNAVGFLNPANSFVGDGSALTGLNAGSLSSGLVPVALGGTGAGTPAGARASLAAAANGANSDITALSGLTTPLSVAQGGTGAGSGSSALANLGGASLIGSNTFAGVNVLSNGANLFAGSFSGDGSGLTGLNAANLASGLVPVALGGTGAGTPAGARASLAAAASGTNSDITALSGLATPLSIAQGGTGAGSSSNALANLGAASLTGSNIFAGVNVLSNAANLFAGRFSGDGSGLTGLNAANLASGLVPVALGGTGAGAPAGARANLAAAASGTNTDITALSGLTTPLSIAQGGTGAGSSSNALANLGAASLTGSNIFAGVNVLSNAANLFAGRFSGDGSGLTGLNAANLASGLVPVALGGTGAGSSSNALANLGAASLTGSNIFAGVNVLSNAANLFAGGFSGDGSGLTGLNAASLASGLVPVALGGTGAGAPAGARANLAAAASGTNTDITALSGLTTPLSIAQGGTGAGSSSNALANLGAASLTGSNFFAGVNLLGNSANLFAGSFSGDGSGLTGLNAANLSSGLVPVALGGTGAGAPAGARANLAAAASGTNSDITALSGLTTPLSIAQGGTGAGSSSNALANLGAASLTGSNIFAGVNVLSNSANVFAGSFSGDGSQLTNLNAASLAAGLLPNAQLAGTYSGVVNFNNQADSFVGSFTGTGSGLTNINAATLGGLTSAGFWQLGGNTGTSAGTNFLGTTDGQALELKSAGGVAINTNNPGGKSLSVNGSVGITSSNALEFGSDVPGKQANAGKIGYQTFTPGALDIVGAGTNATTRKIKFWAEGGATVNATGTNPPLTVLNTVDETTSVTLAAPFSTWQLGQNKPPDARSAFDCFFVYQQNAGATRLLITSDGKVGIGTNSPIHALDMASGAYCSAGGAWTSVSDRNAKEDFSPIQPRDVLAKVAALPISQWKYKAEPPGVRHLGPMAQDFHAAFSLGDSDKAIATLDADGVALAAIQGLNEIVKQKDAQIQALTLQNQLFERRLKDLESRLDHFLPPPDNL